MELANLRLETNVNISQEKLGSRVVQVEKNHVYIEIHVYNLQFKKSKSLGTAIQTVS